MEASEMIGESNAEVRNTQDLATLVADTLMDIASAADSELDLCYTPGELSRPDGGITLSILLDSASGSFSLIEDRIKALFWCYSIKKSSLRFCQLSS